MARKTVVNSSSGATASHPTRVASKSVAEAPEDALSQLAGAERRLHARAYHHWVSLLGDARFPAIGSLDPAAIGDFAANSVLLDFRGSRDNPVIAHIGAALREECGMDARPGRIADVPERSLLARLTAHCGQILTDEAPAGFEAEFVNARGHTTLYRGILLPYSSDGLMIDFVHGVVNWKEVADPLLQAALDSALLASVEGRGASPPVPAAADPWARQAAAPLPEPAKNPAVIAPLPWITDAAPGTPVVLVGHVAPDSGVAITGSVIGDARLADRVLRASQ